MAEVCRKNEESARVIVVWRKDPSIALSHFLVDWPCKNGDYLHIPAEGFHDEWELHLDAVLVLVIVNIQHMEALLCFKLVHYFDVDVQRADGSAILIRIGEGAARKVFMVRGTKYEDSFNLVGAGDILIGPGRSRSTEVQPSVGDNYALYPPLLFVLLALSPVDVLAQLSAELGRYLMVDLRLLVYHSPACRHCRLCLSIPVNYNEQASSILGLLQPSLKGIINLAVLRLNFDDDHQSSLQAILFSFSRSSSRNFSTSCTIYSSNFSSRRVSLIICLIWPSDSLNSVISSLLMSLRCWRASLMGRKLKSSVNSSTLRQSLSILRLPKISESSSSSSQSQSYMFIGYSRISLATQSSAASARKNSASSHAILLKKLLKLAVVITTFPESGTRQKSRSRCLFITQQQYNQNQVFQQNITHHNHLGTSSMHLLSGLWTMILFQQAFSLMAEFKYYFIYLI